MLSIWLNGLLRHRPGAIFGPAAGVALAVALLALLGAFLVTSSRSMTADAIAAVPVDWQVMLSAGTVQNAAIAAVGESVQHLRLQTVAYADVPGFVADTGGTVQTTGPGKALGITPGYLTDFPGQLRVLIGSTDGAAITQQTAANLHAAVGDVIRIKRLGLPPAEVKVTGVVDLPNADSMFQAAGNAGSASNGATTPAPPDNVVIIPLQQWHALFDGQASGQPGATQIQLHVALDHAALPRDPVTAYIAVSAAARNLEARLAGAGIVGDNLAARLDAVRGDALYAIVLFLFLGTPGALLAILLGRSIAASGIGRRRREQSLLRIRGASVRQILGLVAVEASITGMVGICLGLGTAALAAGMLFGSALFSPIGAVWAGAAALFGTAATAIAVLLPAWRDARRLTVAGAAAPVRLGERPLWQRLHLDLVLLLLAGVLFWQMQRQGYQIVVAPEGVPSASIDYYAFISPTCLWIALALGATRLLQVTLGPGRRVLSAMLRPLAGRLAPLAAAALNRQRARVTKAFAIIMLAMAFGTSTAIFDATYRAQALVDAGLTNGADVAVTGSQAIPADSYLPRLAALPDVLALQPMQHRFAYVGSDLQDLYGIDPANIGAATPMSNAYFQNGDATATLADLAKTPEGILVSAETVTDYQLRTGDRVNLRLLNAADHQYHKVPFRLVGIVREFPTAPRDSFLVANAAYVASQTGSAAAEVLLIRSRGDPKKTAAAVAAALGQTSGLRISDIGGSLRLVNSSLTAVDVSGLTEIELGFAILMLFAAAAIVFILDLAERQRSFAIMAMAGAKPSQIRVFIWSEALLVFIGGSVLGALAGLVLAKMLVTLLAGVFDPPPETLTIPWYYLGILAGTILASAVVAAVATHFALRRSIVEGLKEG